MITARTLSHTKSNSALGYSFSVEQQDIPNPKDHDVLVKIHAFGVNRADIYQARGQYRPPQDASPILGLEAAGTIIAMGDKCSKHQVGEEVMLLTTGGAYSDHIIVPEWRILTKPTTLSIPEAATIIETLATSYHALMNLAKLKPSDTVLIIGGAGGVGSTAIQLAKSMGSTVVTTATSKEKAHYCQSIGADTVIHIADDTNFEILAKKNIDVVLDILGGEHINHYLQALKPFGRIVNIGLIQGTEVNTSFAPMLLKQLSIHGMTLRNLPEEMIYNLLEDIRSTILPLYENGRIKPTLSQTYKAKQAREAHKKMDSYKHMGKLAIDWILSK